MRPFNTVQYGQFILDKVTPSSKTVRVGTVNMDKSDESEKCHPP